MRTMVVLGKKEKTYYPTDRWDNMIIVEDWKDIIDALDEAFEANDVTVDVGFDTDIEQIIKTVVILLKEKDWEYYYVFDGEQWREVSIYK